MSSGKIIVKISLVCPWCQFYGFHGIQKAFMFRNREIQDIFNAIVSLILLHAGLNFNPREDPGQYPRISRRRPFV